MIDAAKIIKHPSRFLRSNPVRGVPASVLVPVPDMPALLSPLSHRPQFSGGRGHHCRPLPACARMHVQEP
ncbi:protein of unknown function [Sterolibacterium denitrificans]|uniref:Uncharacterized protein n=1 Tax=Sterolibacterium denitrificans TaxID=157592 RepID=A0A7Z7HQ25_9PROT|nr:hypothetical protein [Sterolibacterium denitrificans]SMB24117.1 protein of unknown function [Sterolibacterium denitrificans]